MKGEENRLGNLTDLAVRLAKLKSEGRNIQGNHRIVIQEIMFMRFPEG